MWKKFSISALSTARPGYRCLPNRMKHLSEERIIKQQYFYLYSAEQQRSNQLLLLEHSPSTLYRYIVAYFSMKHLHTVSESDLHEMEGRQTSLSDVYHLRCVVFVLFSMFCPIVGPVVLSLIHPKCRITCFTHNCIWKLFDCFPSLIMALIIK